METANKHLLRHVYAEISKGNVQPLLDSPTLRNLLVSGNTNGEVRDAMQRLLGLSWK